MKIIAELFELPDGRVLPHLTALNEDGQPYEAMTMTLLDFVSELPPDDLEFEALLSRVEADEYAPANAALPDWSENDKLIWLRQPEADPGQICISNENVQDYSVEFGRPQSFSIQSFRLVRKHWRDFLRSVRTEGKERWLGKKLEFEIE